VLHSFLYDYQLFVLVCGHSLFIAIEEAGHFVAIFLVPFVDILLCGVLDFRQAKRLPTDIEKLPVGEGSNISNLLGSLPHNTANP
jgi:hypothetical protein